MRYRVTHKTQCFKCLLLRVKIGQKEKALLKYDLVTNALSCSNLFLHFMQV